MRDPLRDSLDPRDLQGNQTFLPMDKADLDAAICYEGMDVRIKTRKGEDLTVHLRLIRYSEIPKFLELWTHDFFEGTRFCIESPQDMDFDSLTDDSIAHLVEVNRELNFTRAQARIEKEIAWAEKTGEGVLKLAEQMSFLFRLFLPTQPSQADGQKQN